nr:MAG TPA_asm: hypothetical protein [Caudoviricetes sp.]
MPTPRSTIIRFFISVYVKLLLLYRFLTLISYLWRAFNYQTRCKDRIFPNISQMFSRIFSTNMPIFNRTNYDFR